MELTHSFTVPVPLDQAWDVLLDVEKVAPCMPGATLDSVTGDEITGKIKVKVGPISMTYAGKAKFTERNREAGVVTLEASGKETRGAGTASASVRSELTGQGNETHVTVLTNLNVTGKPAQFGRGVLSEVGGRLIGIFADNLAKLLAAEPPAAGVPATGALPIEELDLPLRAYNSLRREGVHTVGDLAACTPQQLLAIDHIGPASVDDIRQRLASRGLSLSEAPAGSLDTAPGGAPAGTAAANGSGPAGTAAGPRETPPARLRPVPAAPAGAPSWQANDEAIDLLSVAGLPVLKRAIPVAAGVVAIAVVVVSIRRVRRRSRG
ncbi:MAG TPA: DNA-directed RNA polymerase subunit alpha C-terminal domain-containing protein [Streptosporangiaceae bacterium]|nr:DNA-directed RNA polymerase subunit alpha C-terminal domain-containing protein [Streptosporangiaceae bacterium]